MSETVLTASSRILVVGAGVAGVHAVDGLRAAGFDGSVTVVDADPHLPYDRPPLSKEFLTGVLDEDDVRLWTTGRVKDLQVDLRLSTTAVGLDTQRRRVAVHSAGEGADQLAYDRLILATGVKASRPSTLAILDGVHVLRSLTDARTLRDRLRATSGPVVVVGGGFIGGEVATSARTLGHDVTMIERGSNLLSAVLSPDLARPLQHLHESRGVRVLHGRTVTALHGRDCVECIELEDGTRLPAAVVVLGLGGRPETNWLSRSGLALADGIRTDDHLRTSVEGIFAIGDAACRFDDKGGPLARLQHWTSAVRQGQYLARSLLGVEGAFDEVPYIWTDQQGARLQIAGITTMDDEVLLLDGGEGTDGYLALTRRGPDLGRVIALNRSRDFKKLRRTLADSPSWDSVTTRPLTLHSPGART